MNPGKIFAISLVTSIVIYFVGLILVIVGVVPMHTYELCMAYVIIAFGIVSLVVLIITQIPQKDNGMRSIDEILRDWKQSMKGEADEEEEDD